jgi:prepilin-type N-terminal cleavage/methylation domain-containing protein
VRADRGFSLIEVMIASALLATSITMLAQLFAISVGNNVIARQTTIAVVLAAQKIEQLRAGRPLSLSAASTLRISTEGYVDYLGSDGTPLGGAGLTVPDGTAYIRRWSVESMTAGSAVLLQVAVTRRANARDSLVGATAGSSEGARVASLTAIVRRAP